MEKELKKIHQIGIRVNDEVFETLLSIATKQRWTVSATANYIIEQFCKDQKEIRL